MAFPALANRHAFDEAIKNPKAVIKFTAPWCGPCKAFQPLLEQVATQHPDVQFFEVNIDEAPDLAIPFHVRSVPTTVGFSDGKLQWQFTGLVNGKAVQDHLAKL